MKITVLTIFPELFSYLGEAPILKRAQEKGILEVRILDVKDYADGSFRHIDDSPYGGGAGMVLKCEPLFKALKEAGEGRRIVFSPAGRIYDQELAHEYLKEDHLILLCGHYEGIDQRAIDACDEELSMGDYILSGGELPALTLIDSLGRLLEGALRKESTEEESFEDGLLEYPQYTKPAVYEGKEVPEVLLSGDHEKIRRWRLKQSLLRTQERRPDLLQKRGLSIEEEALLQEREDFLYDEEEEGEESVDIEAFNNKYSPILLEFMQAYRLGNNDPRFREALRNLTQVLRKIKKPSQVRAVDAISEEGARRAWLYAFSLAFGEEEAEDHEEALYRELLQLAAAYPEK